MGAQGHETEHLMAITIYWYYILDTLRETFFLGYTHFIKAEAIAISTEFVTNICDIESYMPLLAGI